VTNIRDLDGRSPMRPWCFVLAMLSGEYDERAVAKRAGFRVGDIVFSFDGRTGRMSEPEVLMHAVQRKRPGDEVTVVVLRNGEGRVMRFALR
jgi:S1-C subfamily serine protease